MVVFKSQFNEDCTAKNRFSSLVGGSFMPDADVIDFETKGIEPIGISNGIVSDIAKQPVVWFLNQENGDKAWVPQQEYDILLPVLAGKPKNISVSIDYGTTDKGDGYFIKYEAIN